MKEIRIVVDQTKCIKCSKDVNEDNSLSCYSITIKRNKVYVKDGFECFDCAGWNGYPPAGRAHIGHGTEEYERRMRAGQLED